MATTGQLEHKADATRGRIEETLAELRERLSPPQLIEEALGYAQDNGGADFVRNLGRQVADNPLPVALMGAGLAWLMVAQSRSNGARPAGIERVNESKRMQTMPNYENDRRSEMGDSQDTTGVTGKAKEMLGRASDMAGRARETTSSAYGKVSQTMSSAVDTVSSAMPSTRGVTNFLQEEPMVLAGIGLALGAVIGALLPTTEMEERYIGPTADQLKEQAKSMAREQWERGKELAAEGWDEAKDTAFRTWEDAKGEAQRGWENTQERMASDGSGQTGDYTGTHSPLVPSGREGERERMANTASRGDSRS